MADDNDKDYSKFSADPTAYVFNRVSRWAEIAFKSVWSGFREVFKVCIYDVWHFWVTDFAKVEDSLWSNLLTPYVESGYIDQDQAANLYKLRKSMSPYDILLFIGLQFRLINSVLDVNLDAAQSFMSHAQNKKLRPALPPSGTIMQAAFIAPEKSGEVREYLKQQGLPDDAIDLMFLSMYRLYDEQTIMTLYHRGVLSSEKTVERLQELGYTATRIEELTQSWDLIPGPQDLLHMVAKEAFEPDAIAAMGLGDEFPEDQVQWLEKQGLSRFWAEKYWYAHWEQPSIQMGFEMLHRGVIDWNDLNQLFKTIEIPPFWREKLTEIAYTPLTRVDIRRMHNAGVLDEQAVYDAYKSLGYNDDHAYQMLEFTLAINKQDSKELTKAQILKAYRDRAMSADDALSFLVNMGYTQDTAQYLITFEDYEQDVEYQQMQLDNIKDSYINNLIDRPEAQKLLDALDLPSTQVKLLLDKWDIVVVKNKKLPSKTDLKKFLQLGIINVDAFRREMEKLGYSYTYSGYYEQEAIKTAAKGAVIK